MTSGFSGDFYGGITTGRSISMNNGNAQAPYRSQQQQNQQQLPSGIILDPSSHPHQILNRRPDLIRKRPLPEFQTLHGHLQHQQQQQYLLHQYHQQQQQGLNGLNSLFLRSVKPRTYHHTSPISPLSPVEFSSAASISPDLQSTRFGTVPVLRQQTPLAPVPDPNPEMKMLNRLQELEKQLLNDDDDDDRNDQGDAVSVVTNSEWSETIQTLMSAPPPNPSPNNQNSAVVSPSPTTSTSSSSSSSSVVSPPHACPKQLLVDAATAVSEGSAEKAMEILTRAFQACDFKGRSDQRVAAHVATALRRRIGCAAVKGEAAEVFGAEHAVAMQVLCETMPCFKLGLWAANQAILDATSDLPAKIHVVDFDGGAGAVQYLNLVHALAARGGGKPVALKITSVGSAGVDERLRKLCERPGVVSVSLNAVNQVGSDLSRESLCCEPDEALLVNLAFKLYRMPDESVRTDNPRDDLLRRVKALGPRLVTVVEQEMNGNTAPLVARVAEVYSYYGTVLDSLDSVMARDHPDRVRLEEGLGRKMANSVACEGAERVERCEMFGKWRARLRMAGFEARGMSQNVAESLQARVNSGTRGNVGFTVKEEGGGICFGWMGRTLTVASAWR